MKKTLIAFFVLSVLVAACPVFAVNYSKAPKGFRGIKWDVPIKDYPNTFKRAEDISHHPGEAAYEKIKEKRSFAGHQIDRVVYFFDSVGFERAWVFAEVERGMGLSIYNDFIKACSLQWGEGVEFQFPEAPDDKNYGWQFPSSRAVVNWSSEVQGDTVSLFVYSIAGRDREQERRSLKGETDF